MHDVAIVGAGPAGVAASVYLKRAGFDIVLFEKNEVGGLLNNAHIVENYPGFPRGIKGFELCKLFSSQLSRWNIRPIKFEITDISMDGNDFLLSFDEQQDKFKTVIVAPGTVPKQIDIPGEDKFIGKFVFYEVKDLSPLIKSGNSCIVIGGGDAAFDYSLNLAEKNVTVDLFYRSKQPKCLPLLIKRVNISSYIKQHPIFKPVKINEKDGKAEVVFCSENDNESSYCADFVLIACGRKPNEELISKDFIESNISGFFIAGDVRTGKFRQTGIAVGQGIQAAMQVEEYLRGKTK